MKAPMARLLLMIFTLATSQNWKKRENIVILLVSEEQYITLPLSLNPRWNKLHIYDKIG
jgi:hypothetical protein